MCGEYQWLTVLWALVCVISASIIEIKSKNTGLAFFFFMLGLIPALYINSHICFDPDDPSNYF